MASSWPGLQTAALRRQREVTVDGSGKVDQLSLTLLQSFVEVCQSVEQSLALLSG